MSNKNYFRKYEKLDFHTWRMNEETICKLYLCSMCVCILQGWEIESITRKHFDEHLTIKYLTIESSKLRRIRVKIIEKRYLRLLVLKLGWIDDRIRILWIKKKVSLTWYFVQFSNCRLKTFYTNSPLLTKFSYWTWRESIKAYKF